MKNKLTIIIGVVVLLAVAIFALRFWSGGEDSWLCQDGEWVAHGKPSSPKPQTACGDKKTISEETVTKEVPKVAEGPNIKIISPSANSVVTSPLKVTGEAKGWYFEAVFPVKVVDENGKVLAQGQAKATSDWTTDAFVPFEAELDFNPGGAKSGQIVFEKDNPSGNPENAASFSLPVVFGN